MKNKKKILNDPVHGFIAIPDQIVFKLIEHPWFQRLRRIQQLGLSNMVYPGAHHNRFHHAIGAMHLMHTALESLTSKGVFILDHEKRGALVAILLHDIGHGPFSHALEHTIVKGIHHEEVSLMVMERLNEEFNGELTTGIEIFKGTYPKKFLHQLVSSQLDMDRMDYLQRDSFFTGVSEGIISSERIIKMLDVVDDQLVVEEKGIYSIEKFLVARRLMYWQVYLHKTVVSAEFLLMKILMRAKNSSQLSEEHISPTLTFFLKNSITDSDMESSSELLGKFMELDDYDIWAAIKLWVNSDDKVLADLCDRLLHRRLLKIRIHSEPIDEIVLKDKRKSIQDIWNYSSEESAYFVFSGELSNEAYDPVGEEIRILYKTGEIKDIVSASDNLNISSLSGRVKKYFYCYPAMD
ncbi:MAG: HD domain-containing protein [Flavobacteriales bacterium]|nr:HD domain-containing protein [Flavobacteriales bacterium]